MQLKGVGETTSTALVAMMGNASEFDNGSSPPGSAWCRISTAQAARPRLGRIAKAGDTCIRSLLVLGARAVLNAAANKTDSLSRWALQLRERRGYWKAVIAIAAKNARMAWAVLTKGEAIKMPA